MKKGEHYKSKVKQICEDNGLGLETQRMVEGIVRGYMV